MGGKKTSITVEKELWLKAEASLCSYLKIWSIDISYLSSNRKSWNFLQNLL